MAFLPDIIDSFCHRLNPSHAESSFGSSGIFTAEFQEELTLDV